MHGRGEAARPKRRRSSVHLDDSTSDPTSSYARSAFTDAELLAFEDPAESSCKSERYLSLSDLPDYAKRGAQIAKIDCGSYHERMPPEKLHNVSPSSISWIRQDLDC